MNIGDTVEVIKIPDDLPPQDRRLIKLFNACLGKSFQIAAFDGELAELHVGKVFNEDDAKHRIWLPEEFLKIVAV